MKNETIIFGGKFGYGIPDDLIEKRDSFWLPIGNVKFETTKRKYRRRHNKTCPFCFEKKKNIRRHYQLYHKKEHYRFFIKPFKDAQIGELYGVRFIET